MRAVIFDSIGDMPDSLGDRMKGYEQAARTVLPGRMPVILRVDGKAFHSYTKGCEKPFDEKLQGVMNQTAEALCVGIQGAQFAYVQSDEISILVHNYKKLTTSSWFDNQVQKMVSVAAAIASTTFTTNSWKIWMPTGPEADELASPHQYIKPALFDARVFVLPEAEVCNYFLWRQQDAIRNSVQSLARSMFSHKECDNKSCAELEAMCHLAGTTWDKLPVYNQRGRTIVKQEYEIVVGDNVTSRTHWIVDFEPPLFNEGRSYINDYLKVEES